MKSLLVAVVASIGLIHGCTPTQYDLPPLPPPPSPPVSLTTYSSGMTMNLDYSLITSITLAGNVT